MFFCLFEGVEYGVRKTFRQMGVGGEDSVFRACEGSLLLLRPEGGMEIAAETHKCVCV